MTTKPVTPAPPASPNPPPSAPQVPAPGKAFSDIAADVDAFEAQFKSDYKGLSAAAKTAFDDFLTVAHDSGGQVFGALKNAVTTIKAGK